MRLQPAVRCPLHYIRYGYIMHRMRKNRAHRPLTPAVLYILLALSDQERHGYGIMKQVRADSNGKIKMGPGTLYGAIGRMLDQGLLSESDKKVDPKIDDERRVYYRITSLGQQRLAAEVERYRDVVAVAELRHLSWNPLGYDTETLPSTLPKLVRQTAQPLSGAVPCAFW